MTKDILILILIIFLSYFFTISQLDKQYLFIIFSISAIVLYKLLHSNYVLPQPYNPQFLSYQQVVEGFNVPTNIIDEEKIKQFLDGVQNLQASKTTSPEDAATIQNLKDIAVSISTNLEQLSKTIQNSNITNTTNNATNILSVAAQNAILAEKIRNIEDKITKARQKLINEEIKRTSQSYPKIPVYSSCVVADASGGFSIDTPQTPQTVSQTSANSTLMNSSSTSLSSSRTPDFNNSTITTTGLGDLMSSILKNGITLNLT